MLAFHDFRAEHRDSHHFLPQLARWQSERLIHTHSDFHSDPRYREGLDFLFQDLYSHQDFSERDRDLERIFPKLVKLLPARVLETVSVLVELNQLTQELDIALTRQLQPDPQAPINAKDYCAAYRACNNLPTRQLQLQRVHEAGLKLEKYARSQTIALGLRMTEGAADMAGLSALHGFIQRGFRAFHSMHGVPALLNTICERENSLLLSIFAGETPTTFQSFTPGTSHDGTLP